LHLLVDSTGLKLCGSGEWLLEKHGMKTRRSWRKLHIAVDTDTGQIAAAALTTSDVDDASQVGPLLDQVNGSVASFTADGAYDQDGVYCSNGLLGGFKDTSVSMHARCRRGRGWSLAHIPTSYQTALVQIAIKFF